MKKISIAFLAITALLISACNNTTSNSQPPGSSEELVFERGNIIEGPNFTGTAYLHNLITADSLNQNSVGSVTFEPGARTSWHLHPAGQIILAIDGVGYYQEEGKPVEIVRKGDAVKCPHNIPHWHGASPDSKFVQVAITGRENGP
ncbi:MAG: cupin domain-containing protein, partial [Bacteroidales bacterium]|nr:cupin domain-containing protein [Bacteroidales bacterium]